ncbi:unnamed protein product [Fusarium venenatum]|uniref:LysM domain-containing protein n=1 Tax=Fusarium venenatum TaxID=56646 RepID=A0A2L2T222_9HYPO|nr:uncharacterized protein FVRRES_00011 [Fusarium venenatum]CEI63499.1 unnamed protein product [Fusarium venenatum]
MDSGVFSMYRMLCGLLVFCPLVLGHTGHHHLHKRHHQHSHHHDGMEARSDISISDAESAVEKALAALAEINKARVDHPSFNKYEMVEDSDLSLAGPLDYSSNSTKAKRDTGAAPYVIPSELQDAARTLAESKPQKPSGDHAQVAARIKAKYDHKNNDTNSPDPLDRPDGRLGEFGPDSKQKVMERAAGYWTVDMPQLGLAPYAPKGYKASVRRNVKDFGTKGDGKTDDTAAINRAISDGQRCGPECGASTKVPAYYNTQFLGDVSQEHNVPTILAASSFVGLGVITSDVYITDDQQWYLNTANFLRSIRNFKMDIRLTNPTAYVCAIHWQVAQATSLENIEFYMLYNSEVPSNTQQGIYMENGSGGFMADLTFVGGNFGAYFGKQQFTTSHLVFVNCNTAVQVHWDWAWTMHDYVIESCGSGLVVVGGAGGLESSGQSVGSLILVDSIIANTPKGIVSSLVGENSTSFLLQNVGFFNVKQSVTDATKNKVLVAGGNEVVLKSWGFGQIKNATSDTGFFVNGDNIPAMNRSKSLLGSQYDKLQPNLFSRRRPKYYDEPKNDTIVLNSILSGAANTSSIVYFPYGVYIVTDTLRVPIGSRIIGQAWSQIMGKGSNFQNELKPRAVVQVGRRGDVGIIEIQDIMFTVNGATAGAVVVEWNAREATQGSVGLWDSHIRVGGAAGSDLQYTNCPKLFGSVNPKCKAASTLFHLTPGSSAYLENAWNWVADHDLDRKNRDQVDVYVARGMLIESDLAYLWGTASEHCFFYQYQLSNASNILMGMIQTETPYYQPTPQAPKLFEASVGLFANDPTFKECKDDRCRMSLAVRILDSTAVYILGTGLYSWFYNYKQDCVKTQNCQTKGFEVEESYDLWVYNLCTKAIIEMVSPLNSTPTYARDNVNGFLSSILAWLQGSKEVAGKRAFPGFLIYQPDDVIEFDVPENCQTALTQRVLCDWDVSDFTQPKYRGSLESKNVISKFTSVSDYTKMPREEMCETCYVKRLAMMQASPYSIYDDYYERQLQYIYTKCGLKGNTTVPNSLTPELEDNSLDCVTDEWYTTSTGETCDSIGLKRGVSSASLFIVNQYRLPNCSADAVIEPGTKLCMPAQCDRVHQLRTEEDCHLLESNATNELLEGDVQLYNPWVGYNCIKLQEFTAAYGNIICFGPEFEQNNTSSDSTDTTTPQPFNPYTYDKIAPPTGAKVPQGTTERCGRWYVAGKEDSCAHICAVSSIDIDLLFMVNTGLGTDAAACSAKLVAGNAYCVGPNHDWKDPYPQRTSVSTTIYITDGYVWPAETGE